MEPGGLERARAFASKDAAAAHLAQVDVDVRSGSYVTRSDLTFQEYAEQWLARQVHQRASTAAQAESRLRLHAYPAIGSMPLARVTRAHVQDLVADARLAPSSVEVLFAYVRAVFASAVEDRLLPVSPCRRIRRPQVERSRLEPLTVAEVEKVAGGVPGHLSAMVWVGAGSGLRPGELRSLTADRVAGGVLRVDRQLTSETRAARVVWGPLKNDASYRSVPLAPSTWERLRVHLETFPPRPAHGLVFASARGTPLTRGLLADAWAGSSVRGRGWHQLRHHHASLLIAAGLSPRAVADRLGHADPAETLRTYAHLWPSDESRILDAVEGSHGWSGEVGADL